MMYDLFYPCAFTLKNLKYIKCDACHSSFAHEHLLFKVLKCQAIPLSRQTHSWRPENVYRSVSCTCCSGCTAFGVDTYFLYDKREH